MGCFLSKTKRDVRTSQEVDLEAQKAVLHRDLSVVPPCALTTSNDNTIDLSLGWRVYDGSGGAAVSCLGHSYHQRIEAAMSRSVSYAATTTFGSAANGLFCKRLVDSTKGIMAKVVLYNSGSDAVEAAVKLAVQYFRTKGEEDRVHFISREQSYHGTTGFALALSGHRARREPFKKLMREEIWHRVSSCFEYLQREDGTSIEQYVRDKADELDRKFLEIGEGKVAAFVCETIVGAALGCAPAVEGYLKAMQDVCHKHGALFIVDEIMCGMGRTGKTLHAFLKHPGVRPDILVVGKGIAAGMQPVSAMLCNHTVINVLGDNEESFNHGHTFQNHPRGSAAGLEVLQIIDEFNLLENVERQGDHLYELMCKKIAVLPHVSPIRGEALFLGFSLVKDKLTKESFDPKLRVAAAIHEKGWKDPKYAIYVYPGTGSAEDGLGGDHLIIAPPFTVTETENKRFVDRLELLLKDYFDELDTRFKEKSYEDSDDSGVSM